MSLNHIAIGCISRINLENGRYRLLVQNTWYKCVATFRRNYYSCLKLLLFLAIAIRTTRTNNAEYMKAMLKMRKVGICEDEPGLAETAN